MAMGITLKHPHRVLAIGSIAAIAMACVVAVLSGGRGPAVSITVERIDVSEDGEIVIWTKEQIWRNIRTESTLRGMDGTNQLLGEGVSIGSHGPFSRWLSPAGGEGFVTQQSTDPESVELYVREGDRYRLRYGEELVMAQYVKGRGEHRETVELVETVMAP